MLEEFGMQFPYHIMNNHTTEILQKISEPSTSFKFKLRGSEVESGGMLIFSALVELFLWEFCVEIYFFKGQSLI